MIISRFLIERRRLNLFQVMWMLLVGIILSSCGWTGFPSDTIIEDISLDEAQELVSFPICLPTYIPQEVDPIPYIIYDADSADVPEETYIRLRYDRQDTQEKIFEVSQVISNSPEMQLTYTVSRLESMQGKAKASLIYWIFPKALSRSEFSEIESQISIEAEANQTDHTVYWLYEIVEPREFRSTMTNWTRDQIEYRIYSLLPADEIIKITESLVECSNR